MSGALCLAIGAPLVLAHSASAEAVVPEPLLGTAASYSVLAARTVTNTGPSVLSGSAGVSPGSAISGFPPGRVLRPGTLERATPVAAQAQADALAAYTDADGRTPPETVPNDLVGRTVLPGLYTAGGPLALNGTVTLDGGGNPAAVFIFQSRSTLIVGSGSRVLLTNGAQACHVYWQVDDSSTIGTNSAFVGTILAQQSVSLATGATLQGRAIALNGAVTLQSNVITNGTCVDAPGTGGSSAPSSTPPTSTTPTTAAPTTALPPITTPPTTTRPTTTTVSVPTTTGPTATAPTTTGRSTTPTGTTVAPPAGNTGSTGSTGSTGPSMTFATTTTATTEVGGTTTGPSTGFVPDSPQVPITPVGGVNTGGGSSTAGVASTTSVLGAIIVLLAAALVTSGLRRSRRG